MKKTKLELKVKVPRPRPTLRKKREPVKLKPEEVAYSVKRDHVPELNIKSTANAWWLDQIKVGRLIDAFENSATIEEACVYAKITVAQYRYFTDIHPDFPQIKDALIQLPNIKTKQVLVKSLQEGALNTAMWWAERKMKKEFSTRQEITGPEGGPVEVSPEKKARLDKLLKKNRNEK